MERSDLGKFSKLLILNKSPVVSGWILVVVSSLILLNSNKSPVISGKAQNGFR